MALTDQIETVLTVSAELSAMSLDMPDVANHPNKMPFSGVLTFVDQPSDAPPGGSAGRRTFLPRDVAAALLPSLLGMPVDFAAKFDGHDKHRKIGTITGATVDDPQAGNAVRIEGFFFAADFPDVCAKIQKEKERLGFSYEIKAQTLVDGGFLRIVGGAFTGAAVLFKDKAAYQSTSLAASTAGEFPNMTPEELAAAIAAAMKPLADQMTVVAGQVAQIQASGTAALDASRETRDKIAPHATALRTCAAAMEAAGIGAHGTHGHVAHLHRMAASMEAEAAAGKVPHIYRDHDWTIHAGAPVQQLAAAAQVDLANDPTLKAITDALAKVTTQVTDLKASAFKGSPAPERRTLPTETLTLLRKSGISIEGDKKVSVADLDAAAEKAGLHRDQSIALKLSLTQAGLLDV